jgi:hypothetical protein
MNPLFLCCTNCSFKQYKNNNFLITTNTSNQYYYVDLNTIGLINCNMLNDQIIIRKSCQFVPYWWDLGKFNISDNVLVSVNFLSWRLNQHPGWRRLQNKIGSKQTDRLQQSIQLYIVVHMNIGTDTPVYNVILWYWYTSV